MIGTCCILGRFPRTKETLPDFREWCRVTRHLRVFRGLTGCQRTLGKWGVIILFWDLYGNVIFKFDMKLVGSYLILNQFESV